MFGKAAAFFVSIFVFFNLTAPAIPESLSFEQLSELTDGFTKKGLIGRQTIAVL